MSATPVWNQWMSIFSHPETFIFLIPIVAIVMGCMVKIVKSLARHRERMAMIERGMNPDFPPAQDDPQESV